MVWRSLERSSWRWFGRALAGVWVAAVIAISLEGHARPGWIASFAASPERVREGKVWFLFTSGMLVDRPIIVSLVCFVALAALAVMLVGVGTFWWSAFLGQVAATLLVYALVGAVRWVVPAALESVVASPDYGVSTVSAAWLGSIAAFGWHGRARSWIGRCWIAVSCVAVGLFAYTVRPDLSVLSSEHLVAFALGVAGASPGFWRAALDATWRKPASKIGALSASRRRRAGFVVAAAAAPVAVAIAAPVGLAALHREIASRIRPTVTRCAHDWNGPLGAPRKAIRWQATTFASLTTTRLTIVRGFGGEARPPVWVDYCRYAFVGRSTTTVVLGMWRRGRVAGWTLHDEPRVAAPRRGNASVRPDGRIRLHPRRGQRLVLSS